MLTIDFGRKRRAAPSIVNGPVLLRPGEPQDAAEWIALRERSRPHLTRWEPDWRRDDVSVEAVRQRLRQQARERRAGAALPLFAFDRDDGALIGGVNLSNMRYHASCSAQLGYWIGEGYLRRGYAYAAVTAVLRHAFESLGLNRIEAACQPDNTPSRGLLAKAGFEEEGYAREYLYINGAWRDHVLYALTARMFAVQRAP